MLIDAGAQSSEVLCLGAGAAFIRLDKLTTVVSLMLSFLFSSFIWRNMLLEELLARLQLKPSAYLNRCETAGMSWMLVCALEVFYFRKSNDLRWYNTDQSW